jgi:hypothetical protein
MSVTNKRLVGPSQLTNAAATVYTAPAATQTTIKHIQVANTTAGAVTFTLSIGADAAATELFSAYSIAANSVLSIFVLFFLAATETLQAKASANASLTLTIDGQELTVP